RGFELAELLGLQPFELADDERPLYHAGAVIASNYLVTVHRAAADLLLAAGAPPEALEPLMLRTIENEFELTGPVSRGDWETVEAHMRAIHDEAPDLEAMYRVLAEARDREDRLHDRGAARDAASGHRRTRPDDGSTACGTHVAL